MTDRDTGNKLTVRRVLLRRYPSLAHFEDNAKVRELLDPVNSRLGDKIEKWYAIGYRAAETSRLRLEFAKHKIDDRQIAADLKCSLAAVNRMWNGITAFRKSELLETRYSKVFNNHKAPSGNEMFVAGSCLAIERLFAHVEKLLSDLDISICIADPVPAMEPVNFCFLFYLLRDKSWNLGKCTNAAASLLQSAHSIHRSVRDSVLGDNGRFQCTLPKLPEELEEIYKTWFPWFFIVVEVIVRPGYPLIPADELKDFL